MFCLCIFAGSLKSIFLLFFPKGNTPRIQALKAQDKELAKYLESTYAYLLRLNHGENLLNLNERGFSSQCFLSLFIKSAWRLNLQIQTFVLLLNYYFLL